MKKWEDLSRKEKDFWNTLAKKHQKALQIINYTKISGCPGCKFKPKSWAEFEFHFFSTHGIPREVLLEAMGILI